MSERLLGHEVAGAAVDHAGAGDGNILGVGGADEDLGGLVGGIGARENARAGREVEGDAGLERERAGEQHATGGHDNSAAAGGVGGVDSGLERGAVVSNAVELRAKRFW